MSYSIIATPGFKQEIKKLSKKYVSLKKEYLALVTSLEKQPVQGTPIGHHCIKYDYLLPQKEKEKVAEQG